MINIRNFVRAALRAPLNTTATTLQLQAGQGGLFALPAGDYVYLTLTDPAGSEIVRYQSTGAVVADSIVVVRAQDGTAARPFPTGTCVTVNLNVQQLKDIIAAQFAALAPSLIPATPANTIIVSAPPIAPPSSVSVLYAIDTTASPARVYFWNSTLTTPAWAVTGDGIGVAPPPPTTVLPGAGINVVSAGSSATVSAKAKPVPSNLALTQAGELQVYQMSTDAAVAASGGSINFVVTGPPGALAYSSGFKQVGPSLAIDALENLEFTIPASGQITFAIVALPAFVGRYSRMYTFRDAAGNWLGCTNSVFIELQ